MSYDVSCVLLKNMNAAEIHVQNLMGEENVRQRYRMFKDGKQKFTMRSKVVCRPFVMSDDLVQSIDQNICERWHFTIPELSCEFPQTLHTVSSMLSQLG
jgi:hypothetical protein